MRFFTWPLECKLKQKCSITVSKQKCSQWKKLSRSLHRPYALTSRLHNNDAMLGVKTCRAARTCFAGRAHWRSPSQSVCAPGPALRHAGVCPLSMLGDGARGVPSLTPNNGGALLKYAYGLLAGSVNVYYIWKFYGKKRKLKSGVLDYFFLESFGLYTLLLYPVCKLALLMCVII